MQTKTKIAVLLAVACYASSQVSPALAYQGEELSKLLSRASKPIDSLEEVPGARVQIIDKFSTPTITVEYGKVNGEQVVLKTYYADLDTMLPEPEQDPTVVPASPDSSIETSEDLLTSEQVDITTLPKTAPETLKKIATVLHSAKSTRVLWEYSNESETFTSHNARKMVIADSSLMSSKAQNLPLKTNANRESSITLELEPWGKISKVLDKPEAARKIATPKSASWFYYATFISDPSVSIDFFTSLGCELRTGSFTGDNRTYMPPPLQGHNIFTNSSRTGMATKLDFGGPNTMDTVIEQKYIGATHHVSPEGTVTSRRASNDEMVFKNKSIDPHVSYSFSIGHFARNPFCKLGGIRYTLDKVQIWASGATYMRGSRNRAPHHEAYALMHNSNGSQLWRVLAQRPNEGFHCLIGPACFGEPLEATVRAS